MTQPHAKQPLLLPSRRDFLKTSSIVAAGASIASLGTAQMAHAAGSDVLRIGLIGCGGRGSGAAKDCLSAPGNHKLVAVGDIFEDKLNSSVKNLSGDGSIKERVDLPKERQFVGFDAYQKVLDAGVDLVILATPPGFRPQHFEAAINAGKHVFMEKPVATDAVGVRKVLASAKIAKEKNLGVGVGLQRRHEPKYIETVKRLQDGIIGDIVATRVYWNGSTPWVKKREDLEKAAGRKLTEMEYQLRNWYYFTWICGDHICEQHIHNLDVGAWVKGAYPVKANGMGGCEVRRGPDYGETFDHHAVEFEFPDGTRMFSQCRHIPGCWNSVTEWVHGTKGWANVSGGQIEVKGGESWKYSLPRGQKNDSPYRIEHVDLLESIRSGKPINEGEQGALSSMTAILGRMCTYSGKEIGWDSALNSGMNLVPDVTSFESQAPIAHLAIPGVTQVV